MVEVVVVLVSRNGRPSIQRTCERLHTHWTRTPVGECRTGHALTAGMRYHRYRVGADWLSMANVGGSRFSVTPGVSEGQWTTVLATHRPVRRCSRYGRNGSTRRRRGEVFLWRRRVVLQQTPRTPRR